VVVPDPGYVGRPDGYPYDDAYVEPPAAEFYEPAPRIAPSVAPRSYTYAVGTRVPESVRLAPLPRLVVAQNPTLRPYRYMVFRDRVLLVDPETSTIVADVTQ
jgi:hypothetical protein